MNNNNRVEYPRTSPPPHVVLRRRGPALCSCMGAWRNTAIAGPGGGGKTKEISMANIGVKGGGKMECFSNEKNPKNQLYWLKTHEG